MNVVVLLDDDYRVLKIVEKILIAQFSTLEVVQFAEPELMLGFLETNKVFLVISDFQMPCMNGIVVFDVATDNLEVMPKWIIFSACQTAIFHKNVRERKICLVAKPDFQKLLEVVGDYLES